MYYKKAKQFPKKKSIQSESISKSKTVQNLIPNAKEKVNHS